MSNSNSNIISYLNGAAVPINLTGGFVHMILGTLGNIFNIIIFTRPTLRNNPCAFYFLIGSIFNILNVYTNVLSRFLASSWNIDPSATNSFLCQLRSFSLYPTSALVLWFVVFASIDRFLSTSSSVKFRQLSNLLLAQKISLIVILITYLAHIHIFFFFRADSQIGCTHGGRKYGVFFICQYVIFYVIIPIILMTLFGILMIRNVRRVRNRVAPQGNNEQTQRLRSNDRQLFRMLLLQIIVCTIISMPFAVINIYNTIYSNILGLTRSTYDQAFYSFCQYGLKVILTITHLMQYLPITVQQRLQGENNLGIRDASRAINRTVNIIRLNQQKQPPIVTSGL
ncbi:unnamed protein product [Adineta ricciae]|uniref:G-protein coupled receptors family 1 profile domain-containing protein n=1 Tax=Adineta ricciae TaxID=249248 RepID=A0A815SNA2_ADIRI|nr:unnamed protein product [Adineta ricciae]CAF1495675.1 unnamed protein product [Adineta ricciae]